MLLFVSIQVLVKEVQDLDMGRIRELSQADFPFYWELFLEVHDGLNESMVRLDLPVDFVASILHSISFVVSFHQNQMHFVALCLSWLNEFVYLR